MVRDAFDLAKEKGKDRGGAIIFIDEVRGGGRLGELVAEARRQAPSSYPTRRELRIQREPRASAPPSSPPQIDAVGGKRQESEESGSREVTRTMLELLNQVRAVRRWGWGRWGGY